jgi:kynurenine formamidase
MTRVFYDLSDTLSNETSSFEFNKHEITYIGPEITALESENWGLGPSYWPDGVALSAEVVTLSTHSGTHVDAPLHYGPAASGHTRTIDEVPLEWPESHATASRPSSRASGTRCSRSTSCS